MFDNDNENKDYKDLIEEPIELEYIYRMPIPLRIAAIIILLSLVAVPIFFLSKTSSEGGSHNFFIIILALFPGLLSLIFYKKRYLFTATGIWVIDKDRGDHFKSSKPKLLLEWKDYSYYKRGWFGFRFYKENKRDKPPDDIQSGLGSFEIISKSQFIFCDHEESSQIEYYIMGKNIYPNNL